MNKEKKTKWIVFYKYNVIHNDSETDEIRECEFQDMVEHTNIFSALLDYVKIYYDYYQKVPMYRDVFPGIQWGTGFEIKIYRIK